MNNNPTGINQYTKDGGSKTKLKKSTQYMLTVNKTRRKMPTEWRNKAAAFLRASRAPLRGKKK